MSKPFENVQTGFNHNIRHNDQLYHVQTEDLGRSNPQIVTHVFLGGAVVGSLRISYQDKLAEPDVDAWVRSAMQEQHKQMLRNVVKGQLTTSTEAEAKSEEPVSEEPVSEEPVTAPEVAHAPEIDARSLFPANDTKDKTLDDVLKAYFESLKK